MGMKLPLGLCRTCAKKVGARQKWCEEHRPMKYRNRVTEATVDGRPVRVQSAREARRYGELLLMQQGGLISGLKTQVSYPLTVNGQRVATYVADFVYLSDGKEVVEDSKGYRTRYYKLKARLFLAVYGHPIREV